MDKLKPNFKQIKKKVIQYHHDENVENIPLNPSHKVSFKGIKRYIGVTPLSENEDQTKNLIYKSPIKNNNEKAPKFDTNRDGCNKFSILLESKGFSNCGSARKKFDENMFRAPMPFLGDSSKHKTLVDPTNFRINTDRSEQKIGIDKYFKQINTERIESKPITPKISTKTLFESNNSKLILDRKVSRPETDRTPERSRIDEITEKCRIIKSKQYSNPNNLGELSSLNKLKNKLISPLKKKSESQPEAYKAEEKINPFEQSSILSENDIVNMSKTNESIDFDMSPHL